MPKVKNRSNKKKDTKKALLKPAPIDDDLEYLEKIVLGTGNEILEQDKDSDEEAEIPTETREYKQPAWVDEDDVLAAQDDSNKNVKQTLREHKFKQIARQPKWAKCSSGYKQDKILNSCGNLVKKPKSLEKRIIHIKRLRDLNTQTYLEGPINEIKFHPKSTVALVAGYKGVSLFQVDGKENPKLQSIRFNKFPITCASFVKDAEEIIVGSLFYRYFNAYNLMTGQIYKINNFKLDGLHTMKKILVSPNDKVIAVCGNFGKIYILSAVTKECIDILQMNGDVISVAFNSDGSKLFSHGTEGEVYEWDMNSRQCIQKFIDDGCLSGTSISVSSNDIYLACGSSSGVVNIYETKDIMRNKFQPIKTFYNLVTPVTQVGFNPTSEIFSMCSNKKSNAVKLIHSQSMTAFCNFPTELDRLDIPTCFDFSPNSGYYAVGDAKKTAHLFRLNYYGNY